MGPKHLVINTEETKILKWCYRQEEAQAIAWRSPEHIQYRDVNDIAFSYLMNRSQ